MVVSCCAYNCSARFEKGNNLKWHKFPLVKESLCKRWLTAMKREDFKPSKWSYLCGKHFVADDYKFSNSARLKDDIVPSIFDFPGHLLNVAKDYHLKRERSVCLKNHHAAKAKQKCEK